MEGKIGLLAVQLSQFRPAAPIHTKPRDSHSLLLIRRNADGILNLYRTTKRRYPT